MPRFEVDASTFDSGFDKDATPRWQMVSERGDAFVNLINAANLVVRSRNVNIATFDEPPSGIGTAKRELLISARSPGRTFIDVFARSSPTRVLTTVLTKLEVFVKAQTSPLNIAFQFVTDHIFSKTKRSRAIITPLLSDLNNTYLSQVNIGFRSRTADIQVETSHHRIASEQKDGDRRKHSDPEWNALILHGDPGAHINVFFMSGTGMPNKRPSRMLGDEFGNIVCDDGMSDPQLQFALPHMIGRFLRCPVTNDESQKHHLMFETRDEGRNRSSIGRNFIPKACTITMWETVREINP